jgi:DNA-binding CsgD family transcriptional regulator
MIIENILGRFSIRIAENGLSALSYHQLTPLMMMDETDCGISFAAGTNATPENELDYSELAVAYYKKCFPNLHPLLCTVKGQKNIERALSQSTPLTLTSKLDEKQDTLLIPTFSPLNCVGIFTLNIEHAQAQLKSPAQAPGLLGQVLMQAQACHVEICRAQAEENADAVKLTDREREILHWVARGKSNGVIAQILGISLHTVTGYLRNIYLKTETNDRTSAAIFAIQQGLLHMQTASNHDAAFDIAV